jgi:hypothetical protein
MRGYCVDCFYLKCFFAFQVKSQLKLLEEC